MKHFLITLVCLAFILSCPILSAQDIKKIKEQKKQAASTNARQTILFNNNWKFHKGDTQDADKENFDDKSWRQLDLPHDWSIEGPFDQQWASGTGYLPGGIGWYRKTFRITTEMQSKKIYIYFDGVYNNSEVWINGHHLGKRPNGYTPFQYELTRYLNKAGNNIISVKVDHTQFADSRWYTGSGIYRNVYLVATNPVSIDLWGIAFTTEQVSSETAVGKIDVSVTNHSTLNTEVIVRSRLIDKQGKAVGNTQQSFKLKSMGNGHARMSIPVKKPLLWSVENPSLYTLEVFLDVQGKRTDYVVQQVGFRSFRFDKDKGFFFNEKNMKLKGVCIHDDAGALGVAVPKEVWERRLKILKEAGCNSIRMSHNPHADYVYDLCDEMGFLVIDEAFDEWELGKNKWIKGWNVGTPGKDGYHQYFKEWAERDLGDMVRRSRNHASIIMWSIGNEIDYPNDPYSHEVLNTGNNPQIYGKGYMPDYPPASRLTEIGKQLVKVVKKYDTTRPVTAALAGVVMSNEVGLPEVLDVVGYNYQEFRYADDHKKYPERHIHGSENGMQLNNWYAVLNNDYIPAQYLWTGVDYLGEARQWPARSSQAGLLDLAGFPKSEYYFRQSLWSDQPMIYIGTGPLQRDTSRRSRPIAIRSWNYKVGDTVRVNCFTNCIEAELWLNGKSLGRKLLAEAKDRIIYWNVMYQPGELVVKGFNNGAEISRDTVKTAGDAYAIQAIADRSSLVQTKKDLVHITITVVDKNGIPVYNADQEITVSIEGPGTLLGLESGNSSSHEDYKSNKRKVYRGKLLAYIQSQQKPGPIKIRLSAPGLQPTSVDIHSDN